MASTEGPIERVAVIAVHGISNQSPGETLHAVSNALLRLNDSNKGIYYGFNEETAVRIPVRRVELGNAAPVAATAATSTANGSYKKPWYKKYNERSEYVQSLHQATQPSPPTLQARAGDSPADPKDFAHHFMCEQLREYRPTDSDRVFETQRLVSQRHGPEGPSEVHLYEMYWADLSRLQSGVLRFFGELYQLLFHLSSLGRQTVDFALAEHVEDSSASSWRVLSWLQGTASWFLTRPIPILNLLMMAVILIALVAAIPETFTTTIALGVVGALAATAAVIFLYRSEKRFLTALIVLPGAAIALAAVVASALDYRDLFAYRKVVAVLAATLVSAIFVLVMKAYERRRPGAMLVATTLGTPILIAVVLLLVLPAPNRDQHVTRMLWIIELVFALLGLCWIVTSLLSIAASVAGFNAIQATKKVGDAVANSRAGRAVTTALMTLSVPSIGFLIITIALYWGFVKALKASSDIGTLHYVPLLTFLFGPSAADLTGYKFADQLVQVSAAPAFVVLLFLLIFASAYAVMGMLPAILFDVRKPGSSKAGSDPALNSERLGTWLDAGYQLILVACGLLFLAFPIVYGISVLLWSVGAIKPAEFSKSFVASSALVVAAGGGLMAFRGQLQKLALGFRPALDAVLDVDNYMREHPHDQNPRSRIAARYVSMLRYLCNWIDPRDGGRYSRLVIVSHSQGTVISAELLRFLNKEKNVANGVARLNTDLPVRLITMGCPLRQLYGWRFPHLYQWARHTTTSEPEGADGSSIPNDRGPDPRELNVKRWVNAYCSGDYVGRYLWRTENSEIRWKPGLPSTDSVSSPSRKEVCIGAGAHNHYFDSPADAIRDEIDKLIAR